MATLGDSDMFDGDERKTERGKCPEYGWRGMWDPANWICGGCNGVQFGTDVISEIDTMTRGFGVVLVFEREPPN